MTAEVATITSGRLTAGISTIGAELQHLTASGGRNLQWDGDPAFWRGRAPILFPVIGLLEHGCYRLDRTSYEMPKHGFARRSIFEIVDYGASTVTFRLKATKDTRAIYPFEFQLDLLFVVSNATLSVTAAIANHGNAPMPASFGFHPAFRWPLPFGQPREAHGIRFEHPEPAPIRRIDADGFLLPELLPTPVQGDFLMLRDELFVNDALILDQLESRKVSYGASTGSRLAVEFADFPTLGIWTKPGAGFICIEPWQGFSDPVGFAGDIRDKPGIIEIATGEVNQYTMRISLTD